MNTQAIQTTIETKGDVTHITVGVPTADFFKKVADSAPKPASPKRRTFNVGAWWNGYRHQLGTAGINAPENVPTVVVDALKAAGCEPLGPVDALMLVWNEIFDWAQAPSDQKICELRSRSEMLAKVEADLATILGIPNTSHALDYTTLLAQSINKLQQQNIELQSKYFALRGTEIKS